MTNIRNIDVAILGAGSAGLSARRAARATGASVLMLDPGPFGTTCARVGCMPSKLLIAAAEAAHHARTAPQFGVHPEGVRVDGKEVLARVRSERDRFVGFVDEVLNEARQIGELVDGRARLINPGSLEVQLNGKGSLRVDFQSLVVATGSAPFVPPPFRGLESALLTTDGIFELERLPESLLVIGLGVIGLELGQAFSRLGVRTTLLGVGGAVGPLSDPEVLKETKQVLEAELDLHANYELKNICSVNGGVSISFVDSKGEAREEVFERILVAAGRQANLSKLGLEAYDPPTDARGRIQVDRDTLQLGKAPVFVAGDANQLHPLLHEATDDGQLAGSNAANFPEVRSSVRRTALGIAFTDPQIGVVGTGFRGLKDCEAVAGSVSYENQGRARTQGINRGKLRIYADRRTGVLLGAELFGPRVEHLSHLLAWAIQQRMTVEDALKMPFYHPVVEEGVRTALRDLNANLLYGAPIRCPVSELGPGS